MALIINDNEMVLTGETAKEFRRKITQPDPSVVEKRKRFLNECQSWAKDNVQRRDGKTYIKLSVK